MPNPTPDFDKEFSDWLAAQRISFGIRPTPERMLQSPDSLRPAQRKWLRDFIARRDAARATPEADPEVYACPDGAACKDPECIAENHKRAGGK